MPKFKLKHQKLKTSKIKLVSELVFLLFSCKRVAFLIGTPVEDISITLSPNAMETFVGEALSTAISDSGLQEQSVDKRE